MLEPTVLMTGLAFGESPRWHDGRLWFCDWAAQEVIALAVDGRHEVVARIASFPFCIDFLGDGRLLVLSADDQRILVQEIDGTLATHADLAGVSAFKWNEITLDRRGHAFVNNIGYDFPGGAPAAGFVGVVTLDGTYRQVADDVWFPNGMVVTADDSTLIVAESHGNRLTAFDIADDGGLSNRRVWAELGDGAPDGICLDAEGAVWYADVPHQHCVRVREGGEVLQTVELDRGCFSCALGGATGNTLFIVATEWGGATSMQEGGPTGQVVAVDVAVPAAP